MNNGFSAVEPPFKYRYCCWFCGEPANQQFCFPQRENILLDLTHPPLSVNSCSECLPWANKAFKRDIWLVKEDVKRALMKKYRKHLAIGVNWTKEELANSGFEGGNFESFQKSAWMMFEIARERVNYKGWPLEVNGENIEIFRDSPELTFIFDGVTYPNIDDAIAHYASTVSYTHLTLPTKRIV